MQGFVLGVCLWAVATAAAGTERMQQPSRALDVEVATRMRALELDARVATAADLLRARDAAITELQIRFAEIPSPDYRASSRGRFLVRELRAAGLKNVRQDAEGNVIGVLPGSESGQPAVVLSAHLDTVFPEIESIRVERQGSVLRGPGVADDAAGLAALVHLVRALRDARVPLRRDVVAVGTVGEEGEGDLRGVKHLFEDAFAVGGVHAFLTLDLGSQVQIVNEGLGSRRLRAVVRGPGGHSWGDFGRPNPIHALARGISAFLEAPLPGGGRSSFNVGVIEGGRGVNVIPEEASLRVDLRSESPASLVDLEKSFRRALEQGVEDEGHWSRSASKLELALEVIGDRPVGTTPAASPLVADFVAAFAAHNLPAVLSSSSTDANLPMSLGVPALALPHGVQAHDAHSRSEWCDVTGRGPVLQALLVGLVATAELAGEIVPTRSPTD